MARNLVVHVDLLQLLHFHTGSCTNDAQDVKVDTACSKDNDQQNLSKKIT